MTRAGDDLYVRRETWISKAIVWATRGKDEAATLASHQGVFDTDNTVIEANFTTGVVRKNWDQYLMELRIDGAEWCVLGRSEVLSLEERLDIFQICREMVGWKYSFTELGLQFIDAMIGKLRGKQSLEMDRIFLRHLGDISEKRVICSKVANMPGIRLGWLPDEMKYATPDDSWDFKMASGDWYIKDHSKGWMIPRLIGRRKPGN